MIGFRGLGPAVLLWAALAAATPVPALAQAAGIAVSANPVTGATVTLRWTPATGNARLQVFSQLGIQVLDRVIANDPGQFVWDMDTDSGPPAANGAYLVVVTRADGARFRRRLMVAR